jgi:sec-independent protein translocase protein TatA
MLLGSIILGFFGPQEIIIVLVIVLLLFGGKKIPELMKGLGSGIKEFKDASKDVSKTEETDKVSEKKD